MTLSAFMRCMHVMYAKACHYLTIGQRDKASEALHACLESAEYCDIARTALSNLECLLQPTEVRRIHLPVSDNVAVVYAKTLITIGRRENSDISIMNTDISRDHARIRIQNGECLVEDLGSRNGTRLNGLRIQQQAAVHAHDAIGFGAHTRFEVGIQERPSGISVILTPKDDLAGLAQRYILFSETMFIGADPECELPLRASLTPTSLPYLFKIVYRRPYWYVHIHPHARQVEFNTVPVTDYVVTVAGDTLTVAGFPFVFA